MNSEPETVEQPVAKKPTTPAEAFQVAHDLIRRHGWLRTEEPSRYFSLSVAVTIAIHGDRADVLEGEELALWQRCGRLLHAAIGRGDWLLAEWNADPRRTETEVLLLLRLARALAELTQAEKGIERLNAANANLIRNAEVLADEVVHAHTCGTRPEDVRAVSALIEESRAEGYARAVAMLRDDERFLAWYRDNVERLDDEVVEDERTYADIAADYLEVTKQAEDGGKVNLGDRLRRYHRSPNGCDDCSVEPGELHRYPDCPGNRRDAERSVATDGGNSA